MAVSSCKPIATDRLGREMVEHGTAMFPVACYHDDLKEMAVPWHWHEELEVLVVEKGNVRVGVNGTEYVLGQGEGFFVNAGVLHAVWMENTVGDCRLHSAVFHPRLVGGSVDSILWQKYVEPLITDAGRPYVPFSGNQAWEAEAIRAIERGWEACAAEADGFEFEVREQFSKVIFLLQKYAASKEKPSGKRLREEERMKTMLQFIRSSYREELTLGQIAKSANVSENECLRCFRSIIGVSPMQYVKQTRIQKAMELLVLTDLKVSDIGSLCGFQEMSYFAKTFRAQTGCTPSQYRQRHHT